MHRIAELLQFGRSLTDCPDLRQFEEIEMKFVGHEFPGGCLEDVVLVEESLRVIVVESRVAWLTPGLGRTQPQRSEDGLGRARMSATLQPPHDQVPPTLQGVRVPGGATRWNSPVTFSLNIFPQSSAPNCKVTFWPNIFPLSSAFRGCSNIYEVFSWLDVVIRSLQPRFRFVFVAGSSWW